MDNLVIVENKPNGVTLLTINREKKRNAICSRTAVALQQALREFEESSRQRVAVITGSGNEAFSAGADVNDVPELWRCIPSVGVDCEKPVIAAVAGWCVGGGMILPMMCDLIIAAENARFSYPEAKLGLTQGMIAGLAARIPHKVAMDVMLRARVLDARRAYEVGMVNDLVPTGTQVEYALDVAAEMAQMAPLVLRTLKRFVIRDILPTGSTEAFGRYRREAEIVARSNDFEEGFASFKEKRKPVFTGT
ncbi:enoyl-CoA hydratase-related protein [Diaphorobacter ruginosibacter]|uniref:enoyl-CoA hydratase/isomerase family protein n=1 Tax=Diaphorobacter ruginosibacter TaxID=1715720 RepID=UPI003342BCCD